jgi:hypothetical protein
MIDADGFVVYTCKLCGLPKIAALFTPDEILKGTLRCRLCTGEVGRGTLRNHARRPSEAQQPRAVFSMPGQIFFTPK